jgi:uncharacterized membrane protein YphA (DoxX/SURF4 family)
MKVSVFSNILTNNTRTIVRSILALAFLGHGLVSLGLSPSYDLHFSLIESVNFTNIPTEKLVEIQGWWDLLITLLLIVNFKLRRVLYIILVYLSVVCISALSLYWDRTGSLFGIAECLRRIPWVFLCIYLLLDLKGVKKYHLIRISLSFAFLSHGMASLGFLGINQGHIDLAMKILSEQDARLFIIYSGITDTVIGLMLLKGVLTRYVAIIGMIWILFIVYLSLLTALPDAIFRLGLLFISIYIISDPRCYQKNN